MSSPSKRREIDLMRLMMNDFNVEIINDDIEEVYVQFHGPSESPYQGGVWKVRVVLTKNYPYQPPTISFVNKIYHPNINETIGIVCLFILDKSWSPMFDLVNVFELFLPLLLRYPETSYVLNKEAGALLMSDPASYEQRVKEYCEKFAKPEDIGFATEEKSSDEELTEDEYDSSD